MEFCCFWTNVAVSHFPFLLGWQSLFGSRSFSWWWRWEFGMVLPFDFCCFWTNVALGAFFVFLLGWSGDLEFQLVLELVVMSNWSRLSCRDCLVGCPLVCGGFIGLSSSCLWWIHWWHLKTLSKTYSIQTLHSG